MSHYYISNDNYYLMDFEDLFNNLAGNEIEYPRLEKNKSFNPEDYTNAFVVKNPYEIEEAYKNILREELGLYVEPEYGPIDRAISREERAKKQEQYNQGLVDALNNLNQNEMENLIDRVTEKTRDYLDHVDQRQYMTEVFDNEVQVRFEFQNKKIEENLNLDEMEKSSDYIIIKKADMSWSDENLYEKVLKNPYFKALGANRDNLELTQLDDEEGRSIRITLDNGEKILFANTAVERELEKYKEKEVTYRPPTVDSMVLAF